MIALVTGALGFLGRHVTRRLNEAGYTVLGLGHGAWELEDISSFGLSSWSSCDVTLDSLVAYAEQPDVIVHCAGSGSVAFSMSYPHQDYARTVSSTAAVLEYIRLHSSKTILVYPSSAAVYGIAARLPIKEAAPLRPASPYGAHKVMAEELCRSYASIYGLSIAIVRFFSIYGEGLQKQLLWDACNKIVRGEHDFFGTGAELRDWLHVEDAARLIQRAIGHASQAAPIINGGSGNGVSVSEILLEVFQRLNTDKRPVFSGAARPGDPLGYEADMTAAVKWGWSPKIPWREGVHRYVEWFKGEMQ